mmetsp:Transcript_15609/g.31666  ORF Transcript_15609/g.31666 Transcript_15609/m.31666 type:complete len:88 (-) Transcript_15609:2691-2954(-)
MSQSNVERREGSRKFSQPPSNSNEPPHIKRCQKKQVKRKKQTKLNIQRRFCRPTGSALSVPPFSLSLSLSSVDQPFSKHACLPRWVE